MRLFIVCVCIVFTAGCTTAPKPRVVLRAQAYQPDAVNNPGHVTTVSTFELQW